MSKKHVMDYTCFEDLKVNDNIYLVYEDVKGKHHVKPLKVKSICNTEKNWLNEHFLDIVTENNSMFTVCKNHMGDFISLKQINLNIKITYEYVYIAASLKVAIDRIFMDKQNKLNTIKIEVENLMKKMMAISSADYIIEK